MLKKTISLLLSFILLIACTIPAFAAEEETQPLADSKLTLEGMWEAYQSHDMEQLQVYFDALGVNNEEEQPTIAPRWASGGPFENIESTMCHQQLTAYGFIMYIGAMQSLFGKPINSMGFTFDDLKQLVECSPKPDHFLTAYFTLYAGHFYDPANGRNYQNQSNDTARTNITYYYQLAKKAFSAGNRTYAMTNLGYALHFLEDACAPHHAANIPANQDGSRHSEFEEYANADLLNSFMESGLLEFDPKPSFYSDYLSCNEGESLHAAAISSKAWINCAQSTNETLMRIAALFTFSNAMSSVSGLLYRFAKDIHMI